jgi:hypothetical protein
MKRIISIMISFLAGFLLYFAWAGFIVDEFKITEYRGHILDKIRSEQVLDMGTVMTTKSNYKIVFSSGKMLTVPYPIYKKLRKGDYTILLEQNDQIIVQK